MAAHSSVLELPLEVRKELERRLTEKSYRSYKELARWLNGLGYKISDAALNRYGVRFERRLRAVGQAPSKRARSARPPQMMMGR